MYSWGQEPARERLGVIRYNRHSLNRVAVCSALIDTENVGVLDLLA